MIFQRQISGVYLLGNLNKTINIPYDILCIPMISQLIALWMEEILHQLVDGADPIMIIMFTLFTVGNYW